ncbi:MAG: glycoside hydrolase family 70 protein [Streptococcus salivarius]
MLKTFLNALTEWELDFQRQRCFGVENVQVSGYLGVWVQSELRLTKMHVQPSNRANSDGQVYKSSAALILKL